MSAIDKIVDTEDISSGDIVMTTNGTTMVEMDTTVLPDTELAKISGFNDNYFKW